MKILQTAAMLSVGAALLWASLATGGQGYGGSWGGFGGATGRSWVRLKGYVLCSKCTLTEVHAPPLTHLCELNHRRGQVVMEVTSVDTALPYRRLWLKGNDSLFEVLAAEENLRKEIEVSGLLREYLPTLGMLDLPTVRVFD